MIWLGIESSCDETACAVLQDDPLKVLSNPLYSQIDEHALYGGVVPEIAARAHLQKIAPIAEAAVKEAGIELKDIDAIAFTTGPGLMGPLLVGASFAKGLARDLSIPAYGMNHLEGHLAAAWLSNPDIEPPFLTLTVSGGHTELVLEEPGFKYTSIGRTRDDAAGEAFDKCGKLLGLKYPAGATISRLGQNGNRKFVEFPRALHTHGNCEFSFSGLKTAVLRYTATLVTKTISALKQTRMKTLVVGGGVSANAWLRTRLQDYCSRHGIRFCIPDRSLSTDNGAMIAAAAIRRARQGLLKSIDVVKPWMPLAV